MRSGSSDVYLTLPMRPVSVLGNESSLLSNPGNCSFPGERREEDSWYCDSEGGRLVTKISTIIAAISFFSFSRSSKMWALKC